MVVVVVTKKENTRNQMNKLLEDCEVINCERFQDAIGLISQNQNNCNMVIAEFDLNPHSGINLLECAKKMNNSINTVLLIGNKNEEEEIEGIKKGIDLIIDCEKGELVNKVYLDRLLAQEKPSYATYIKDNKLVVNGIEVELARKELEVARVLITKMNEAVSREEILEIIWSNNEKTRKVDAHIAGIRRKLDKSGVSNCIASVSGLGYRWDNY